MQKHAETIEKILGLSKAPATNEAEAEPKSTNSPVTGKTARVVNTEGQALMFAPKPEELPPQIGLVGEVEEKPAKGQKKR